MMEVIENKQRIFTKKEVCIKKECSAFDRWMNTHWKDKRFPGYLTDTEGYWYCSHCRRISADQLAICPDCNRYHKGPRFFPYPLECDECS